MNLRERPAVDIVIIAVVTIIGTLLIVTALAVVLIELIHPQSDTTDLVRMESEILGVLVGALVGFIGGRGLGRSEAIDRALEGDDTPVSEP